MDKINIEHFSPPSDEKRIEKILMELDSAIIPKLSGRVNINEYAKKLAHTADIFFVRKEETDIGHCAVYLNNSEFGYISSISVNKEYRRMHIGSKLYKKVDKLAISKGIFTIRLKVFAQNQDALRFYKHMGFEVASIEEEWISMQRRINKSVNTL